VNLDIDNPKTELDDLAKERIAKLEAVDPSDIWMTLICNVNLQPPDPEDYFREVERAYNKTIPDTNKGLITGEEKAAAIHFDGYVGELTPVQVSSLENPDFNLKNYDKEITLLYPHITYY
jgi:hypothetical protein